MVGVTPEANTLSTALGNDSVDVDTVTLCQQQLATAWKALDSSGGEASTVEDSVQLVAVGNPHLSFTEVQKLAELVNQQPGAKHPDVNIVATIGRQILDQAEEAGHKQVLEDWGVEFVTDTCWCMLGDVVPYPPIVNSKTLITNSGKYAHYAPGLVNRRVRYSDLAGCVMTTRTA